MDTIFRQPGKTGIGNLEAGKPAGSFNGNNCHSSSNERKIKMRVNSVIFCLCAGICSSAMIENAFSMNSGLIKDYRKLDSYNAMIVGKYLETKKDLANLVQVTSKFRLTIDKYRFNPVSISPRDVNFWNQVQTLHLYTRQDIEDWKNQVNNFFRVEVHEMLDYNEAKNIFNTLLGLLCDPPKKRGGYVIFHNVMLNNESVDVGELDKDGKFIFNQEIHTRLVSRNSNTFEVDINAYTNHANSIRPVYVLRSLGNFFKEHCSRF